MGEIAELGKKCLIDEAKAIEALVPHIGDDFEKAVELIYNCKGRVITLGVGKSGHIASKIAATLASTGTPAFCINALDAYHGDLGMICPDDIVIAISYSGNTEELIRLMPSLINRRIKIIGMSGNDDSMLAKNCICHLNIYVDHEACPLNLAPTSSTTATLAMGDAISCALMEKRHFDLTDFAKFHPGGSLGKHLSHVRDYMSSDNLPIVKPQTLVSDAMLIISNGKHGLAVVIEKQKVIGIITDGDVRRAMQRDQIQFFSLKVKDIMNLSPKTVLDSDRLSKAASIMQAYKIYALVVIDKENKIKGIIDSISCL